MQARFLVRFTGLAAGLISFVCWTDPIRAQAVYTWSGGASGPWDTSDDSWGGSGSNTLWDSVNGPSNVADFTTAGAVATVSSNASVYANGIIFDSPATIGGATLTLATQAGSTYATPTITVNGSGGTIASGLVTSAGLVTAGPGMLTLSGYTGYDSYAGGTTVASGTLALAAPNNYYAGAISGNLTISPGAFVSLQTQNTLGSGSGFCVTTLNVNGAVIDNANGYDNGYTTNFVLNGGTMSSSGGGNYDFTTGYGITTNASTATSVISSALTSQSGNSLDFNVASGTTQSGVDLLVSGQIQEGWGSSGGITKDGPGVMLVSGGGNGNNWSSGLPYDGPTTVNAGRLILAWDTWSQQPTSSTVYSVAANATLELKISSNWSPDTPSFLITGGGTVVKSGTGTLLFNYYQVGSGTPAIPPPTYTWAMSPGALIDVEGGELQVSDYSSVPDFSNNYASLNIAAGAVFEAMQANVTVDALTGSGTYQAGYYWYRNLTVGVANGSGTFSGVIQGNYTDSGGNQFVSLTKVGMGTETLSGTNTYTGGTTVSGGELIVTAPYGLEDGSNLAVGNDLGAFGYGTVQPAASLGAAPGTEPALAAPFAAVPEPGTPALLAAGAAWGLLWRRRNSKRPRVARV